MFGVLVNAAAVVLGATVGLLFHKFLPKKLGDAVMIGVALCVLYIGVDGMLEGGNPIITILSLSVGAIIGTLLNLDGLVQKLGNVLEQLLRRKNKNQPENAGEDSLSAAKKTNVGEAFVSTSLIFCIGAMAVVGSLSAGLRGDNTTLFAKAVIDGISSVFFAASLGVGVIFSAFSLFIYQGTITLLAGALQGVLNDTVVAEMTCVGSLLLIALSLNLLGITKIKLMNYLPAIFLPILFCLFIH